MKPCELISWQRQQPERLQQAWLHQRRGQRPEQLQPVWLRQPVQLQRAWRHRQPVQRPERLQPVWLQQQEPEPGQQQVPGREPEQEFLSVRKRRVRGRSGQQQEATTFSFFRSFNKKTCRQRKACRRSTKYVSQRRIIQDFMILDYQNPYCKIPFHNPSVVALICSPPSRRISAKRWL